jgi:hypothetical protein
LSACTALPVAETKTFNDSVVAVKGLADPLFSDLGAAERAAYLQHASKTPLARYQLTLDDTDYVSTSGDPPATTLLRQSFQVLVDYSAVLESLADGSQATTTKGELQTLSGDILTIAQLGTLVAPLKALQPLIDQALGAASAAQERALVLQGAQPVIELIEAMRADPSPGVLYHLLIWNLPTSGAWTVDQTKQANVSKTRVADFIRFLGRVEDNFKALKAIFARPTGPMTLAALATTTGEIKADIAAAQAAYAAIRAGTKGATP